MATSRQRPVTIADVAEHAGASRATVSYALTQPSRLSPEMLARVRRSIDELGFVRNDLALRLRAGRSQALGLILPNAANPVFSEIASAAEREAARRDHFVLVGNSNDDVRRERDYLRFFAAQNVAGLLLAPVDSAPGPEWSPGASSVPLVIIGAPNSPHSYPAVTGDDEHGGRIAGEHLLGQGRRRLLFVGGPHENVAARFRGVEQAVTNVPGAQAKFRSVPEQSVRAGESLVSSLLASGELSFDGIAAGNDLLAIGILNELSRGGIAVPGAVSLIGYDDIEFARYAMLPISSIRHPLALLGEKAVRLALGIDRAGSHEFTFDPELVVRATSLSS